MRAPNCHNSYSKVGKGSHSLTSKWGVGWQTPAFMSFCYISAVFTALAHLVLLKSLNGAQADGPNEIAPQSYINNLSHFLPSLFQIALQACLSTAFIQYLWFILRRSAISISIIETLFLIRSSPLLLLKSKWWALKSTLPLLFITSLIWAINVATIFPPGALTIAQVSFNNHSFLTVPTFNASFFGNDTFHDAQNFSLGAIFSSAFLPTTSFVKQWMTGEVYTEPVVLGSCSSKLQLLASNILLGGIATTIPSPCGANCSYTTTFIGPYFDCNSSISNVTYNNNITNSSGYQITLNSAPLYTIYNGSYFPGRLYTNNNTLLKRLPVEPTPYFSITSESLLASDGIEKLIVARQVLKCAPVRVRYVIENRYKNNLQKIESSFIPAQPYALGILTNPNLYVDTKAWTQSISQASISTNSAAEWYSDVNLMNILGAVVTSLSGVYKTDMISTTAIQETKIPGHGDTLWSVVNNTWLDNSEVAQIRPLIADSKLNDHLNIPPRPEEQFPGIGFTITPELLNELLLNVTLSTITSYEYWNTMANVTTTTLINVYAFSSPMSLILPYFLSLAIALPFIILGFWALYRNGVPAIDGSFIQLITATKSARLDSEASVGCLGGFENIPQRLMNMEIKFGELIDRDQVYGEIIKRAGFGTEDEIVPLKKGARYGKPIRSIQIDKEK